MELEWEDCINDDLEAGDTILVNSMPVHIDRMTTAEGAGSEKAEIIGFAFGTNPQTTELMKIALVKGAKRKRLKQPKRIDFIKTASCENLYFREESQVLGLELVMVNRTGKPESVAINVKGILRWLRENRPNLLNEACQDPNALPGEVKIDALPGDKKVEVSVMAKGHGAKVVLSPDEIDRLAEALKGAAQLAREGTVN